MEPATPPPSSLISFRHQLRKARIAFGNRLASTSEDAHEAELLRHLYGAFLDLEQAVSEQLFQQLQRNALYRSLTGLRGIGPSLAAELVSRIDLARAPSVRCLWRYAGLGVRDGRAERLVRGKKSAFNRKLRAACFVLATSLLRCRSPYAEEYYRTKSIYVGRGWTKAHAHRAAVRRMLKLFLAHLWEYGRRLQGLPTRRASDLGAYGWPEVKGGRFDP